MKNLVKILSLLPAFVFAQTQVIPWSDFAGTSNGGGTNCVLTRNSSSFMLTLSFNCSFTPNVINPHAVANITAFSVPNIYLGHIPGWDGATPCELSIVNNVLQITSDNSMVSGFRGTINVSYVNPGIVPYISIESNSQNYTTETIYLTDSESGPSIARVIYFDGLGRPSQKVDVSSSSTEKNIVTPIDYDLFGREDKRYLPYANQSSNIEYYPSALTDVQNYQPYQNEIPFSQFEYEPSPLNRVSRQSAPGNSWAMNSGKEIKYDYQTNSASQVIKYKVLTSANECLTFDIQLIEEGFYDQNLLYKTITKDENWTAGKNNTVEEYKNIFDQVVLKRTYLDNETLDTYYVYDKFGNLTFVLPPLVDKTDGVSSIELENLCYQYIYDTRNRLVKKRIPGKPWENILYDKRNRVVITGPVLNPFGGMQNGFLLTRYDILDRICFTGWFPNADDDSSICLLTADAESVINTVRANNELDGAPIGYNIDNIPADFKLLTINYYDNYNFPNALPNPGSVLGQNVGLNSKGLSTGSWVRVLTTDQEALGETTTTFYDAKLRPIEVYTKNYKGGFTDYNTEYDFSSRVLQKITHHKRINETPKITIAEEFTYSNQGRLVTHTHKVNDNPKELMSRNIYEPLGKLINKNVGGSDLSFYRGLQNIDYKYNIRGWLLEINNVNTLSQSNFPDDLFAFKINYNQVDNSMNNQIVPLFNGNISETYWRSFSDDVRRKYGYKYDALNRLNQAIYQKPDINAAVANSYDESITYDKGGNIQELSRNGNLDDLVVSHQIDNLEYVYDPDNLNRLKKVTDSTLDSNGFKDDSTDIGDVTDDYVYDDFGNMISDANKSITSITYNHLNLPLEISFGTDKILYIYDALGTKVKKVVEKNSVVKVTDYLDGFQYYENILQFFPTAEGYVNYTSGGEVVNNYNYVYSYKDHLGNVRLSYGKDPSDNLTKILQEDHYYPFGLKHSNYNMSAKNYTVEGESEVLIKPIPPGARANYNYKYNGKEYQDELGLNMYDYGARNYDPAIGRWMNIDPLAQKYFTVSPYTHSLNNPMYFVDPNGKQIWIYSDYGDKKNGRREKYSYVKDRDYSKQSGFRADAYKALDALYEAANIEVGGEQVNLVQELMDSDKELSVVKGDKTHFAYGRKIGDRNDTSTRSIKNIGTLYFNNKNGVIFDDVTNPKKPENGGDANYFTNQIKNGRLNKTTSINSPTSVLGHDLGHAYGYMTDPTSYFARKNNKDYSQNGFVFENEEEARATSLSTQINYNLHENPRTNYLGDGVPTQGVLSNQLKR